MDFKDELVKTSSVGFIQGFEDCKAHLKKIVLKLDLIGIAKGASAYEFQNNFKSKMQQKIRLK